MEIDYGLCVKDMSTTLPVKEYIRRFRNVEMFMRRCMECRNYNRTWGCPPYTYDIEEELRHYNSIMITVTVISLSGDRIPLTEWAAITAPQRERLEKMLLVKEKELGGKAFGFGSTCQHCPDGECTRPQGLPCRHPELVQKDTVTGRSSFTAGMRSSSHKSIERQPARTGNEQECEHDKI